MTNLVSKLTPMSKETFKKMLETSEEILIFFGNPRDLGILGREYFASLDDGVYTISYLDWDYNEEYKDSRVEETFTNYDEFWDYLIKMMEDEDYCPEYKFISDSDTSSINEDFKRRMTKERFWQKFNEYPRNVTIFRALKGGLAGDHYQATLTLNGIQITIEKPFDAYNIPKVMWNGMKSLIMPDPIAILPNFDALWDYIIKMIATGDYVGTYNYIDPRLGNATNESIKSTVTEDFLKRKMTKEQFKKYLDRRAGGMGEILFRTRSKPPTYYTINRACRVKDNHWYWIVNTGDFHDLWDGTSHTVAEFDFFEDLWNYIIKMVSDKEKYIGQFEYIDPRISNATNESTTSTVTEAVTSEMTKGQFRRLIGDRATDQPIFRTRAVKPNYYFVSATEDEGFTITIGNSINSENPNIVKVLPDFNALWDYIVRMASDKESYVGVYNYVDTRIKESLTNLTESKRDPFHEVIFETIDYLTEFDYVFPIPADLGIVEWKEFKTEINYGLSSDFEIAEILMEYLKTDLAIAEKHPEIFEDDPQSELTLETYTRLKRAYTKAVAEYKAAYPEDFQENFFNKPQGVSLNESAAAVAMTAGQLALGALEWIIGGYIGFTVGGWIWDRTKDILNAFRTHIRKITHQNMTSQWIAYKSYLIEITEDYVINVWNPDGDQLYTGLRSVKAAKRKINQLPIPEIVSELSVALEDALLSDPSLPADYQEVSEMESSGLSSSSIEEDNADLLKEEADLSDTVVDAVGISSNLFWGNLLGGFVLDCLQDLRHGLFAHKPKSKWLLYKNYLIERDTQGLINVWDLKGRLIHVDVKTMVRAKTIINSLPVVSDQKDLSKVNSSTQTTLESLSSLTEATESENDSDSAVSTKNSSKESKQVNTSEIDGLDFEAACQKYNVKVEV